MVGVRGVVIAYLLAVVGWLADVVDSGVGFERGYTLLRKVEVIRPVEAALLGFGVGPNHAPLFARRVARIVVEVRRAVPDEREIFGAAVHVQTVHVDVGVGPGT